MSQPTLQIPADGGSPFDAIKRTDEHGEHWTARDLLPLLDYSRWEDFSAVVEKAKASLAIVQGPEAAAHHFGTFRSDGGRWGSQKLADYRLTRFGAYLTAMAGDDTKETIARARVYFAVKTREAETAPVQRFALPQTFAEALRLAADQAEAIEKQNRQIAALEPRAAQADHYREADGLYAVASFANDLQTWAREHHGVKILHDDVRDFLGDIGLIIRGETVRNNEPKAEALKAGYVRQKHATYETNTRGTKTTTTARLTPKGWGYAWDKAVARIADHGDLTPIRAIEEAAR